MSNKKINFKILTSSPEFFPGILQESVMGKAFGKGIFEIEAINLRDFAFDKRKTIDDECYGDGAGMLMKPEILSEAIEKNAMDKKKLIYFSPRGKLFNQKMARDFAKFDEISMICAKFEGIDERIIEHYEIEEISIGDYILSNGELAAFVFMDAILRNVSGVLGKDESAQEESFCLKESEFLLEYPQYTRPSVWRGREVPEILRSGDHGKVKKWRFEQAIAKTKANRPDLYRKFLDEEN